MRFKLVESINGNVLSINDQKRLIKKALKNDYSKKLFLDFIKEEVYYKEDYEQIKHIINWNMKIDGIIEDYFNLDTVVRDYFMEAIRKTIEINKNNINEEYIVEGIADVKKYYPTIEDKDFERIIKLDPTTNIEKDKVGTYSKWLLNLFKNKKLDNEGHVTDLLNRFESEKNNLVNKDIMKYKSLEDVEDMLNDDNSYKNKTHRQEVRQRQKDRRNVDLNKDAELVYEDSDWEV